MTIKTTDIAPGTKLSIDGDKRVFTACASPKDKGATTRLGPNGMQVFVMSSTGVCPVWSNLDRFNIQVGAKATKGKISKKIAKPEVEAAAAEAAEAPAAPAPAAEPAVLVEASKVTPHGEKVGVFHGGRWVKVDSEGNPTDEPLSDEELVPAAPEAKPAKKSKAKAKSAKA